VSSERSLDRDKIEKEKKKDLDRLKKDLSELTERPPDAKRSRLESPALSSASHTPSPTPPPSRGEAGDNDMEHDEEEAGTAAASSRPLAEPPRRRHGVAPITSLIQHNSAFVRGKASYFL